MSQKEDTQICPTCCTVNSSYSAACRKCKSLLPLDENRPSSEVTNSVSTAIPSSLPSTNDAQGDSSLKEPILASSDNYVQQLVGHIRSVPQESGYLQLPSKKPLRNRLSKIIKEERPLVITIVSLLVGFLLAYFVIPPIMSYRPSTTPPAPASRLDLFASIGVVKTSDGELIGISDGTNVFDTTSPAINLKEQAAHQLQLGRLLPALSLLDAAHKQDTRDAETLIYDEDINLIVKHAQYITIIIGTTLTGSSNLNSSSQEILQGAYIAQKEYNDTARKHGDVSVRLLIANSGSKDANVSLVADQITRMVQNDITVVGVMGWPSSALAIKPLSDAHIPMVSMASGDGFTNISPYFFRISSPASTQGTVGAQYAIKTLKARSAAIFTDTHDDYTRSLTEGFQANFEGNGNSIVATEYYSVGDATTNPQRLAGQLQDALQHHPDIIYFAGYSPDVSILLQQMKTSDPIVVGGNALYALSGYMNVPSSSLSHLRFAALAYPNEWDVLGLSAQKPAFFDDYAQAFGSSKTQYIYGYNRATSDTMISYDSTQTLLQASKLVLTNKYPFTTSDMQQGLAELTSQHTFQGVTGQIALGPDGNPINKAITVVCNKDGYFKMEDMVIGQFLLDGPLSTSYPATSACV